VAQRRRRVFVVGYLGDWRRAAAVLFERHSLSGDIKPSRPARSAVAALTANGVGTCGADDNQAQAGHLVPFDRQAIGCYGDGQVASTCNARDYKDATDLVLSSSQQWPADIASTLNAAFGDKQGLENQHVNAGCPLFVSSFKAGQGSKAGGIGYAVEQAPTLTSTTSGTQKAPAVAIQNATRGKSQNGIGVTSKQTMYTLDATSQHGVMADGESLIRRLTPVECERLQGFPDDHTKIEWRNKAACDCPDGPRYKAIGNSMAVPVMRWIGERIEQVDKL